jgi:hypothetical protein
MTQTVRVFRMEDGQGRGPFRGRIVSLMNDAMTGRPEADWHYDMPSSYDAFGDMPRGHVCGTLTLRDMVRWFPRPMRRALAYFDYGLSVYDLPTQAVTHGRNGDADMQVMFVPVDCVTSEWRELRRI